MEALFPVMEAFYTVQGEGAFAGVPAYFIRLAGCDVGCVWCDVKESWDAEDYPKYQASELLTMAEAFPSKLVVITGGEPAMYDLNPLTNAFREKGFRVHIETSAAYPIQGSFDWITLSPKKFKSPVNSELVKANELKIIVFNKSDFDWAQSFVNSVTKECRLFLQPEWEKRETVMPLIVEFVKNQPHWNISLQTHKYLNIP